ncbi:MAG TPA: hypothetical protein PLK46_08015 [Propioniciclava sp.]|jgi:hypothetical protein|uniref:Uncharacterized protein n=1 Tax=Propioniciclava soli TaxID=2775081 RepID=A0ABZ3C8J1_9ACTN|nr:hypothetical protein [Propioniciclava sp.]HRL50170.1 hypothetical protein [Propioniciclava sp.]HRL80257.1 hypothetical protein [Propioniciclava sp.]
MKLLSRIALALATMLALFLPTMAPATAAAPAPTGVAVPMESESACGALFHVQRVSGGFRIYAFSSDLYWMLAPDHYGTARIFVSRDGRAPWLMKSGGTNVSGYRQFDNTYSTSSSMHWVLAELYDDDGFKICEGAYYY